MTTPLAVVQVIVRVADQVCSVRGHDLPDETGVSLCFSGGQINVRGTADQVLFERAERRWMLHEAGYHRLHGAGTVGMDQACFFALLAFIALLDFPREMLPKGMIRSRTR